MTGGKKEERAEILAGRALALVASGQAEVGQTFLMPTAAAD